MQLTCSFFSLVPSSGHLGLVVLENNKYFCLLLQRHERAKTKARFRLPRYFMIYKFDIPIFCNNTSTTKCSCMWSKCNSKTTRIQINDGARDCATYFGYYTLTSVIQWMSSNFLHVRKVFIMTEFVFSRRPI